MPKIPVAGPSITRREVELVAEAAADGWYENAGLYQERFEQAFAEYVGRKFAIALPHCTSALHLALLSLDLQPGEQVIVPEVTWIGSTAPVSYVGGEPVFADIDPDTWCISADSFRANITERTRAVIVVDLYGNLPDMEAILAIAEEHGIAVIEDAAQSVGASYRGRMAGSFGYASTFSFHGTKTITTGEGGMLLTDDEQVYRRCRLLGDHGRLPGERMFWNTEVAFKYRMSAVQAALGLAQLERIDELVAQKRSIFECYRNTLANLPGVRLNHPGPDVDSTYWMVTAILDERLGLQKEAVMAEFAKASIATRPFFYPLSSMPAYSSLPSAARARAENRFAYTISPFGINLPSGYNMNAELIGHVCETFRNILAGH